MILPGQFIPGADSHSRAYGAYGAVGMGVGSTTLGFGWATGYVYFTLPKARRVVFKGRLQPWVSGKDIVLELLRRWGTKQSQGMSVELVDADRQLPIAYRNTIANMMAEAEALNGIFAPDDMTYAWYRSKGISDLPYPPFAPGVDAVYEIDETLELDAVQPMVAKPFSPGNAFAAEEVARERIPFDKAMIGSCTNGSYDDLLTAALVIRAARQRGIAQSARELVVFPGSGGVGRQIERPDPRLDGESIAGVFRSVGGQIRESWCGPCFGQGPDALGPGQRAITSFNRNWQNRMGVGGEGYLASPAVVAASALRRLHGAAERARIDMGSRTFWRVIGSNCGMKLVAAAVLVVLSIPAASAQSDLDAFMQRVLARRDDNWKKLQQFILDEREDDRAAGPGPVGDVGRAPRVHLVHPRRPLRPQPAAFQRCRNRRRRPAEVRGRFRPARTGAREAPRREADGESSIRRSRNS